MVVVNKEVMNQGRASISNFDQEEAGFEHNKSIELHITGQQGRYRAS